MRLKYPTLLSLYVAQSIPMSFFSSVVPVIMRQEHFSLEAIGLLQLVKLPWILKFLWAPMVDNTARNRTQLRRWIVASELFYALVIIMISMLSLQTNFSLIVVLMFLAIAASATQDIATDLFAIRILTHNEKAVGNGIQSAGSFIGSLMGAGVLLLVYNYFGWTYLLLLLAGFVLFAVVPLYFYRPEADAPGGEGERASFRTTISFYTSSFGKKRLLLLIFYFAGLMGIMAMLKPWMVDLGYSISEIGVMYGIVGTSSAAVASMAGGFIIRYIGRIRALYLFALVNIATALYFYTLSATTPSTAALYAGIILILCAYGFSMVIIFTSSMDAVRPTSAGSDFTSQIVLTHISAMIMATTSGRVADAIGYRGLFGVEIVLAVVALATVLYAYPPKAFRRTSAD